MWSETSVLEQDRSETKKIGLVFFLQVLCCVVKYNLVTLVVIMILEDTAAFQVLVWFLYFMLGTSLLWRSTVTFTYLKVKSAKCLCFRWSWSWSFSLGLICSGWSWSCYFGLGLKNLVLFTSLHGLRAGGACCPSSRTPPRSRPSASIFGP